MKNMNNVYEDRPMGLLAKALCKFGECLTEIGDPCLFWIWYEPSLPPEVIEDMTE